MKSKVAIPLLDNLVLDILIFVDFDVLSLGFWIKHIKFRQYRVFILSLKKLLQLYLS